MSIEVEAFDEKSYRAPILQLAQNCSACTSSHSFPLFLLLIATISHSFHFYYNIDVRTPKRYARTTQQQHILLVLTIVIVVARKINNNGTV